LSLEEESWSFAASYYIVREIRIGAGDVFA
jgi:hypothetical protein